MVKSIGKIVLYDVDDIAKALKMNPRVIREWFNKGKLRGKKVGRTWMITEENLKDFFSGKEGGEGIRPEKRKRKKTKTIKEDV
jgi:hypothetical protein